MKPISASGTQGQPGQCIAAARRGKVIAVAGGDKVGTQGPGTLLDLESGSPELEAELLKAANGPFRPYRESELREIADRALREHRAKRQK